ncbi:MAG TPA: DCC1-like thiol-disulfide oxidoreductase family protein [Candidatus Acidoferrales bacterium]
MKNGWTGGQYSVFRIFFGAYLCLYFLELLSLAREMDSAAGALAGRAASPFLGLFPNVLALWDSPLAVRLLLVAAVTCAVLFAAGKWDRWAALGALYALVCLRVWGPEILPHLWLPYVGSLLLAHAFLPRAPYGSMEARARTDPAGGWRMTESIFLLAWVLMAVGYSYSGYTKLISASWTDGTALLRVLENPLARPGIPRDILLAMPEVLLRLATWGTLALELLFAPLALIRRARPWLWTVMLVMHFNLMTVINFIDLSMGMVILHFFTLDPAWIRPVALAFRPASSSARNDIPSTEWLFYDGSCGLCHRAVRFVLAEDRTGEAFRFAPLDGDRFNELIPEADRAALPDSLVVRTADGRLLTRSTGVLHIMARLGGLWRVMSIVVRVIPATLRDAAYDFIAAIRYRLFARPKDACPLLPPHLRQRFDL